MNYPVYLLGSLATHRKSRILKQLFGADAVIPEGETVALPEEGVCLFFGQEFQHTKSDQQRLIFNWCQKPGRTFMLIPPYDSGTLLDGSKDIDWSITYADGDLIGKKNSLPSVVSDEVVFTIQSDTPVFDRESGHQWANYNLNSLIYKHHASTGVFAATTLPLWSISLIGSQRLLMDWVGQIHEKAGTPLDNDIEKDDLTDHQTNLQDQDYSVLVCVYAYQTYKAKELGKKLSEQDFPIFTFDKLWLESSFERLESHGCIKKDAFTEHGLALLKSCPWWEHAQAMKEEL